MNPRATLRRIVLLALLLAISGVIDARKYGGGSNSRRSGSSGYKSNSRPKTPSNQAHPPPYSTGLNVPSPNSKPPYGTHTGTISKSSATPLQSNYPPGGSNVHLPPYSPPIGGGHYNPSSYGGYNNPSSHNYPSGQNYNSPPGYSSHGYVGYNQPPAGHGYNPSSGHGYNSPPAYSPHGYVGYNPSPMGHSYQQPTQTFLVQPAGQAYKPGLGQIAKEAFVYSAVNVGVNAAVNRILPGGIYGHSSYGSSYGHSQPAQPQAGNTQITYNYYNNGSSSPPQVQPTNQNSAAPVAPVAPVVPGAPVGPPAPGAPAGVPAPVPAPTGVATQQQPAPGVYMGPLNNEPPKDPGTLQAINNPSPLGYIIHNEELMKLSEDLFAKDKNNANKYITMKLQGQKKDDSNTDDASEKLLTVAPEAYDIPTVKSVLTLHDNYALDYHTKEDVTAEERKEESDLLDVFAETEVMKATKNFLAEKGYIPSDDYEFRDTLRRIWFTQFQRGPGDASSSGFETVYLAEQFDNDIIGLRNWIYFAKKEESGQLNYLGYIHESKLGNNGAIVKLRLSLNGIVQPVTAIFVGTSPELEMALYTICFYTRPNNVCNMSLGGTQFLMKVDRVNYYGKEILVSASPSI